MLHHANRQGRGPFAVSILAVCIGVVYLATYSGNERLVPKAQATPSITLAQPDDPFANGTMSPDATVIPKWTDDQPYPQSNADNIGPSELFKGENTALAIVSATPDVQYPCDLLVGRNGGTLAAIPAWHDDSTHNNLGTVTPASLPKYDNQFTGQPPNPLAATPADRANDRVGNIVQTPEVGGIEPTAPIPANAGDTIQWQAKCPVAGAPGPGLLDNFDSGLNAAWASISGGSPTISANTQQATGVSGAGTISVFGTTNYGPDEEAQVKVNTATANGDSIRLFVRGNGNNGYALRVTEQSGDDRWTIRELTGGAESDVGLNFNVEVNAGDTIKVSVTGATLTAYLNGVSKFSRTDSVAPIYTAAGTIGLGINGTLGRVDDFSGGTSGQQGGGFVYSNTITTTVKPNVSTLAAGPTPSFPPVLAKKIGVFDTNCNPQPTLRDTADPFVFPGVASPHDHDFLGNRSTNRNSTFSSLMGAHREDLDGRDPAPPYPIQSTGVGGPTIPAPCGDNRDGAGYWIPSIIRDGVVTPTIPTTPNSDDNAFVKIYYRCGAPDGKDTSQPPDGLGDGLTAQGTNPKCLLFPNGFGVVVKQLLDNGGYATANSSDALSHGTPYGAVWSCGDSVPLYPDPRRCPSSVGGIRGATHMSIVFETPEWWDGTNPTTWANDGPYSCPTPINPTRTAPSVRCFPNPHLAFDEDATHPFRTARLSLHFIFKRCKKADGTFEECTGPIAWDSNGNPTAYACPPETNGPCSTHTFGLGPMPMPPGADMPMDVSTAHGDFFTAWEPLGMAHEWHKCLNQGTFKDLFAANTYTDAQYPGLDPRVINGDYGCHNDFER